MRTIQHSSAFVSQGSLISLERYYFSGCLLFSLPLPSLSLSLPTITSSRCFSNSLAFHSDNVQVVSLFCQHFSFSRRRALFFSLYFPSSLSVVQIGTVQCTYNPIDKKKKRSLEFI